LDDQYKSSSKTSKGSLVFNASWRHSSRDDVGHLALVFDRHPCHQLGCDSVWGRIPHLVDCRTPFVALAVHKHFLLIGLPYGVVENWAKRRVKLTHLRNRKRLAKQLVC
jgi:hypothetical protein